jgi:hypothetical protein
MPGSRTASGFGRYVEEEGHRRMSPEGTKGDALKSQHPWASGTKRPVLSPFRQIYATLIFSLTPLIIWENGDKTRDLSPKPMDTGFGSPYFVPSFVP